MYQGGAGGWVRGGVWYPPSHLLGEGSDTSEAGPGSHRVAGVGGYLRPGAHPIPIPYWGRRRGRSLPTLRARSVSLREPSLVGTLQIAASQPIRAELRSYFSKVSQNGIVSTKSHEKACHSPYSQNAVQKSPLEIPRFLFWPAFSPKELMVLFLTHGHVYCQNDEVSPDVHTSYVTRNERQIPPRCPQQAASGHRSSSGLARYSH